MKKRIFYMTFIALLSGCNCYKGNILQIEEQGSFAVGGTVLTDSLGHKYHGDHAYVFYQKPVDARKYPLVFAHGVGQFSKTWETTPDGRARVSEYISSQRFLHLACRPASPGKCRTEYGAVTLEPVFDEEEWFNRFRVGIYPDYFEGVQFKSRPGSLKPVLPADDADHRTFGLRCLFRCLCCSF